MTTPSLATTSAQDSLAAGTLLSLQVGRVQHMLMPGFTDSRGAAWTSGIFKQAVAVPIHVRRDGLESDEQADLENHGGPDNVILAYDAAHYDHWRMHLAQPDLAFGSFGENFDVSGFSDDTVCIGDIWRVGQSGAGSVVLQITQARQPCFKLARRLARPDIVKSIYEKSWGGWYLRVLQEGVVEPGMPITLLERRHPVWTAAAAVQAMYARKTNPGPARQLATLPELSARWKSELLDS